MEATNPFSWIEALTKGGPWVIVVAMAIALIYLWRAYVKVRDDHEKRLAELHAQVIAMVERQIQTSQSMAHLMDSISGAMERLDRRLENVEKTLS